MLQGLLRNPLATPFLLGISAGAGLVIVALISLGFSLALLPLAAWLGAIVAAGIVFALGRSSGGFDLGRLILAGVSVSAMFNGIQTTLLLSADETRTQLALNWLFGSLNGRGWEDLQLAGPYIALALICSCIAARSLNVLNLGDDMAVSLGASLMRSRLTIGGLATLLTAGAVSISGLVGFIGLLVPHGVRLLTGGNDYRWLVPLSALAGAQLLAAADLLARSGRVELPVGAVTALLGSPLFIWLLYRRSL
jgi:iron complex transport system permease protein